MDTHIRFDRTSDTLFLLDQKVLPLREEYVACRTVDEVIARIRDLTVRGAPAIGVAAGWGAALAAKEAMELCNGVKGTTSPCGARGEAPLSPWRDFVDAALDRLSRARPTAVNLAWAVSRVRAVMRGAKPASAAELYRLWLDEAERMQIEDVAANRAMGRIGAELFDDGDTVLTHCNAGALATAGYGTALGVIRAACEAGKKISVIADETRPVLQGSRLTAYELARDGIPVKVACDNAAGLLMQRGLVHKVIVGADRIAANGDVVNKIGTYGVAVLAKEHGIPFYVAAPLSTIDPAVPDGFAIPIEERDPEEVALCGGGRIMPPGVGACNFAFDLTPARLVTAVVTEKGILRPPYGPAIAALFHQ